MAKESTTKYAVMGILSHGPASGYDIRKQIQESIGHFWNESYGQIYPILKALHEEGCTTRQTESQSGKPDKIVYSLTDKGRRQLEDWLDEPMNYMHVERNELLLKLFFSTGANVRLNLQNIEKYRTRLLEELEELAAIEQRILSKDLDEEYRTYTLISVKYGQFAYTSFVNWCDYTASKLRELEAKETDRVQEGKEIK